MATEYVVKYFGAENILSNLSAHAHNSDIQGIIKLINDQVFYIKLKYGQRRRNEDLKILKNLRSPNETLKATAILQVCYYVRCNILHGSKDFQEYQRLLIEPTSSVI